MSGMVYEWKSRADVPVPAQIVGERLEQVRVQNNGRLTPRAIVEDARPDSSPLHAAFEWNDAEAAECWREEQARYLVRQLVVTMPERQTSEPVRAFVSVERGPGPYYTSTAAAMSDEDLREQVLGNALYELRAWRRKYSGLVELAALFTKIDQIELELND